MALVNETRSQTAQVPMSRIFSPDQVAPPLAGPGLGQWHRPKSTTIPLPAIMQDEVQQAQGSTMSHSSVAQTSWLPHAKPNLCSYPSTRSPSRPPAKSSQRLGPIQVKADQVDALFSMDVTSCRSSLERALTIQQILRPLSSSSPVPGPATFSR